MSFKAKLKVAGKERNILSVDFGMLQETDPTGRPSSVTRGGKIHIVVEGTGETDLFEWMTNSFVKYREDFDSTGDTPLKEVFTLSAREIEMGNAIHTNEWV